MACEDRRQMAVGPVAVTDATPTTDALVLELGELGETDRSLVGGKASALGTLLQGDVPVPRGVVVTTALYRAVVDDPVIHEAFAELDEADPNGDPAREVAARLRTFISEQPLPTEFESELHERLATDQADSSYAVRSSATAEDSATASFAGQHESFLGVAPGAVTARVRDCLASQFTARAAAYRNRVGIPATDAAMGVVVQEMVDADAAGVLFTADPDTGNRRVAAVDATYGLGQAVVDGEVDVDHARLDRTTGEVLDYVVGEKDTVHRLAGDEVETVALDADVRTSRVLTDRQLQQLVELGDRVEQLFGEPQNIEWAIVDGAFVVLQSRPITSLFPVPEPTPDDGRLHVYFSIGHAQAMTEPMPPLALDLWSAVYGDLLAQFAGEYDWVAHAGGRPYLDVTPFLRLGPVREGLIETLATLSETAATGAETLFAERADEIVGSRSIGDTTRALRDGVTLFPALVRTLPTVGRQALLPFVRGADGTDEYRAEFTAWGKGVAAGILDTSEPDELVANAFGGLSAATVFDIAPKSARLLVAPVVEQLLERLVPGATAEQLSAAARGSTDEVGTRMTLALGDLADTARETPAVAAAVRAGEPLDSIRIVDEGDAFVRELRAFLDEFGHRATGEIDPSRPRWRDDPTVPLGLIRVRLEETDAGAHRERLRDRQRDAQTAIDELLTQAGRGPLGPVRRRLVAHLLRTYRSHVHLRDEPKQGSAHLFSAWHEALNRVGEHLVAENVLAEAGDIWYLRRDELDACLAAPHRPLPDLGARRQRHERYKRLDAPPLVTSEGEAPQGPTPEGDATTLTGTAVSPGVTEGRARVVHEPTDVRLDAGDILVCPSSDPAWTPLFATAS